MDVIGWECNYIIQGGKKMKNLALFSIVFMSLLVCFGCGGVQESGEYPKVNIVEPTKNKHLSGEMITFMGEGKDKKISGTDEGGNITWEDITIKGDDLIWTSNIDGQIGTGTDFEIDSLSIGEHTITLTGLGYNQIRASTSIKILIE